MFNKIMKECIENIYREDIVSQTNFFNTVCGKVRRMDADICLKAKAFFVPNNEYLMRYTIPEVMNPQYDIYNFDGDCVWHSCLVFPVFDVGNSIVGLAGFNPVNYLKARETQDWTLNYYSYSKKSVFQKGRYIYAVPGIYEKAISDGYIVVVDGMFDALHLTSCGFNACALMGSTVTDEIIALLRFIRRVIVISDNDDAGVKFSKTLKKHLHNVVEVQQGFTKDVDELLKTDNREKIIKTINEAIIAQFCDVIYLDFGLKK